MVSQVRIIVLPLQDNTRQSTPWVLLYFMSTGCFGFCGGFLASVPDSACVHLYLLWGNSKLNNKGVFVSSSRVFQAVFGLLRRPRCLHTKSGSAKTWNYKIRIATAMFTQRWWWWAESKSINGSCERENTARKWGEKKKDGTHNYMLTFTICAFACVSSN